MMRFQESTGSGEESCKMMRVGGGGGGGGGGVDGDAAGVRRNKMRGGEPSSALWAPYVDVKSCKH